MTYRLVSLALVALLLASCGAKKPLPQAPLDIPKTDIELPAPPQIWRPPLGDSIRHEMRAVWLTTAYGLDWPRSKADTPNGIRQQKEELERILDRLVADGYNTIFFQARLSGNTTYFSEREPFSRVFTKDGERPDYDPLAFAVEACHKRGLQIHAWMVTYPLTSSRQRPHPIVQKNPSWAIAHKGSRHLDPGLPEVRSYITELASDLARRYEVDGIHFDYFRYPEEAEKFNDTKSYARYGKGQDKEAWRRDNLTRQLEQVKDSLQAINPRIQISVAPLGKYRKLSDLGRPHGWTAYESVHQDVETWAQRALVDFVVPMMYYRDHLFEPFVVDWQRTVGKYIPVVVGLAPYRVDPKEERSPWAPEVIHDQILIARQHGTGGVSMFREKNIGPEQPRLRTLIQQAFRLPALMPKLPRGKHPSLVAPSQLKVSSQEGKVHLSWQGVEHPLGVTYRVWCTIVHANGRKESQLLVQGLKQPSCILRLVDFSGGDSIVLGVEAVNALGVSQASTESIEYKLVAQPALEQ